MGESTSPDWQVNIAGFPTRRERGNPEHRTKSLDLPVGGGSLARGDLRQEQFVSRIARHSA